MSQALLPRIESAMAYDGYRFFVRVWDAAPSGDGAADALATGTTRIAKTPSARVFFLHGIISHGGWYETTCARIAAAGFEVHFLDRRGAGLNARARGDVDSCQTWIRDVADYIHASSSDGRPAILAGISWGGKLALAVAKSHPDLLGGLTLICPGLFSRFGSRWLERASVRFGGRTPARRLQVGIPLQHPRLFTNDPAWQRSIARDPLALRRITIRAAKANLELGEYVKGVFACGELPFLMMLAQRDLIIDNAASHRFFDAIEAAQKELVEYPEAAHTLEFGRRPYHHVDDFVAWCERINDNTLDKTQVSEERRCLEKDS